MSKRISATLGLALLLTCGGAATTAKSQPNYTDASEWGIGPIVRGRNHSRGMPLQPTPGPRGSFIIDFPQAPGSVHYVTFPHGSLAGKRRIVMRYRIETDRGARIVPRNFPQWTARITPYFQRRGDNWGARGPYETYRWFATFASPTLTPGEHQIVAPLNANWTAIQTSTARNNPAAFAEALAEADQVGFVLGGGDGYGHGAYAIGGARLVVTSFRVE
jgi:hypothetical protein